jgi:hypothetical protein
MPGLWERPEEWEIAAVRACGVASSAPSRSTRSAPRPPSAPAARNSADHSDNLGPPLAEAGRHRHGDDSDRVPRSSARDLNGRHKPVAMPPEIAKGRATNQTNPERCRPDHVSMRSRRIVISGLQPAPAGFRVTGGDLARLSVLVTTTRLGYSDGRKPSWSTARRTATAGSEGWTRGRATRAEPAGDRDAGVPTAAVLCRPCTSAVSVVGGSGCSGTFHTRNMSPRREEVLLRWRPSPVAIASTGRVVDLWTWNA